MVEIFDNIRKLYLFSPPAEELADYIEFFSESSDEATNAFAGNDCFTVKMFPSWTPTFWINLGTPYYLALENKRYLIQADKDIVITRDAIVERFNQPSDHIFTVKFYPGGLETILGINQTRLTGKPVQLHDLLPPVIIHQIKKANGFWERKKLLEAYFLTRMKAKRPGAHYLELVRKTIATYEKGNMQYNVDELSARLFITSKTINRYFNKAVGISPKSYLSIIRSRAALTAFVSGRKEFDPSRFGYHDVSHFYREIVRFTGERMGANNR